MIKKIISLILVFTFLLMIPGCGIINDDIYIVYTSDVHCNMEGMNYANVKAYKDSLKKDHRYVTLIDGGDFLQGGTIGDNTNGKAIIDLMNDTGYDIVTIGNHEFDFGLDSLEDDLDAAKFDITSCNLNYIGNGKNAFSKIKPYIIKKYGSIRIGYIGVLTLDTITKEMTSADGIYASDGALLIDLYANPNNDDESGEKVFEVIQNTINEVREKADYVVVISHLGDGRNNCLNSDQLIRLTSGIDILLDAHDHSIRNKIITDVVGREVLYFDIGMHLDRMGLIKIKTDNTLEAEYVEYWESDQNVLNKINAYIEEYQ